MRSCSLPAQEPTLKHFSETATENAEMTLPQPTEEGVPFAVNAQTVRDSGSLLRTFDRAR